MFESLKQGFIKTFIRDSRYKIFVEGFKNTIIITIIAAIIGIILGVIVSFVHSLAENARDKHQDSLGARCLMILDKICCNERNTSCDPAYDHDIHRHERIP